MATTLDQQVALDEALVPSAQRAFLVTADVPEIYMHEFWATAKLHQHSIRFKMDTRKHVLDLEAFREMLHISPRILGQSFADLPFEEEILEFLSKAYKEYYACTTGEAAPKPMESARKKTSGSASSTTPPTPIATSTQTTTVVAAPRLYAAAKGKQPARATTPTEPTDVERTEAKQLKIVLKRSRQETHISQQCSSGTDEGTGSRPGVLDVPSDDSEEELSWNYSNDEDVDEQTKGREESEGDKTDESDNDDDEEETTKIGEQEVAESDEGDDEATESDRESLESLFTTGSTTVTPIPSPQSTMTPSIISTFTSASQLPTPPTQIPRLDLQSLPTFVSVFRFKDRVKSLEDNFSNIPGIVKTQVKAQVTRILPRIEEAVNAQLEAEVLIRSSHSSRTSYAVAADLSEMELKKILIENMEGNKSIQQSDEQRNLYKALVEAYDADKTILDTYGESTILKRRQEDNDQEGPSAGSDRGSKRQREEGEHASARTPSKPATGSAGRTTTRSQSRQLFASESAFVKEPVQPTCQMEEPSHPVFETGADEQPIIQTSQHPEWFSQSKRPPTSDHDWNKSVVDTLTPELLAGPTYELIRGSCNSLTELEYHLEEVYKATTDQLDWVNPEVNRESTLDVYSKRRIITVTKLKIVEWHNYKHLDLISVRCDDDKIYKFKEGDLKRLRIQDIEDMLLLLVQGKLSNLTLGVESYQKRLNLTRPDTYQFDLKRREAYTAYSNPRGFIYQNKNKKNRLMRIDELQKFSDGTLNDVRNALDDRLKGIQMQYLSTTIWRRGDKARAAAMIQAINKMLKIKGIMRSLERFVGERQYEGDF
nr:hypothetical protein [Tanacetum cinerariifolium]